MTTALSIQSAEMSKGVKPSLRIGKQVKRFWPAHFFVLFYTIHLAVLGILAG